MAEKNKSSTIQLLKFLNCMGSLWNLLRKKKKSKSNPFPPQKSQIHPSNRRERMAWKAKDSSERGKSGGLKKRQGAEAQENIYAGTKLSD